MSDFSVTRKCRICGVRYAPDDGYGCDCAERLAEARQDYEDMREAQEAEQDIRDAGRGHLLRRWEE